MDFCKRKETERIYGRKCMVMSSPSCTSVCVFKTITEKKKKIKKSKKKKMNKNKIRQISLVNLIVDQKHVFLLSYLFIWRHQRIQFVTFSKDNLLLLSLLLFFFLPRLLHKERLCLSCWALFGSGFLCFKLCQMSAVKKT